jgi:hypothetical protein
MIPVTILRRDLERQSANGGQTERALPVPATPTQR